MRTTMVDSYLSKDIILPGVVLYKNVFNFNKKDISKLEKISNYINNNKNEDFHNIKNRFYFSAEKIKEEEFAKEIQKKILLCMADYCEIYPELIHTIQWQENIYIDFESVLDTQTYTYNPNKSYLKEDRQIENTPFSRQVAVEINVNEDYTGGYYVWPSFDNFIFNNFKNNDLLIYPANYLFSKIHKAIISGTKITISTFFNGGKDFLVDEKSGGGIEDNLLFSYLR